MASLDVDHSGSRVVAGSRDYSVRVFDFNGMKSDLKGFRRVEPSEGHPVHAVSWSPTGACPQNPMRGQPHARRVLGPHRCAPPKPYA